MTERPILFSDSMVRAILAGTKTQTRRVIRADHIPALGRPPRGNLSPCPYGEPGDQLWVREAWRACVEEPEIDLRADGRSLRRSMHGDDDWWARWRARSAGGRWQPSIYMPRWASRLTLEVTSVRVERVQSITQADAKNEGVEATEMGGVFGTPDHVGSFMSLWDSINGERAGCAWRDDPWVWIVGFRRVSP